MHGNKSDLKGIARYYDPSSILICADGGAEYARTLNLIPHMVIGDMDSISKETLQWLEKHKVQIFTYSPEKDFTDSQLAIEKAVEMKCQELAIFGLLGDRMDHMNANIMYLSNVAQKVSLRIIEGDQVIYFVTSNIHLHGTNGDEVSLIPLKGDASGITTSNLQYKLDKAVLPYGSTRGISNVMTSSEAQIQVQEGMVMVVHRSKKS